MINPAQVGPTPSRPRPAMILALVLFVGAIYLVTAVPYPRGLDEIMLMAIGRSIQGHSGFDVDSMSWTEPIAGRMGGSVNGLDGHTYSTKDLGVALITVPFTKIAYWASVSPIHAAQLSMIIVTLLTVVMVYAVAGLWGYPQTTRVLGALVFGLGSQAWPYATSLTGQVAAALGLLIGVWGVEQAHQRHRWTAAFVGGLGMSLAGLSALPTWIVAPVYVIYLVPWEERRAVGWAAMIRSALPLIIAFCAGSALGLAATFAYNIMRQGAPLETGLGKVGNLDFRLSYFPVGAFGMLFGTPTGLLWFVPMVVLAPIGIAMLLRAGRARQVALLVGLGLPVFCLYASYWAWWASNLWGPRYLLLIGPSLALLALPLLDLMSDKATAWWKRLGIVTALALSAVTQLAVTVFDYDYIAHRIPVLLNRYTPPISLAVEAPFLTDLRNLPQVQALTLARQGSWAVLWLLGGRFDGLTFALGVLLIALAGLWFAVALRGRAARWLRYALAVQALLSLSFIVLLMVRYPHSGVPLNPIPPEMPGVTRVVDKIKADGRPGDGVVLLLYPEDSYAWHDYYDSTYPDVTLTIQPVLNGNAQVKLSHLPQWHDRIWLISNVSAAANPDNGVERYLARNAFIGSDVSYENWRVVSFTFAPAAPLIASGARFGEQGIQLKSFSYLPFPQSGQWIDVRLQWQTANTLATDYSVFVHLLDANGQVLAQHDGQPGAGYWPTSSWPPGQTIDDRHTVMLPQGLAPGRYQLSVGLYDPQTGERLRTSGQSLDALTLDTITLPAH